jgi:ribosomal protein S27AE
LQETLIKNLYKNKWVIKAKQPFLGPVQVIEYLGRYTHKIAISNHRIKSIDNGKVSFIWKDYRDGEKRKVMTLQAAEFLRRFCLHILPPGYVRIRHYGLLSCRLKPSLRALQLKMGIVAQKPQKLTWQQICLSRLHFDVDTCPSCGKGIMVMIHRWLQGRAPPTIINELHEKIENKTN